MSQLSSFLQRICKIQSNELRSSDVIDLFKLNEYIHNEQEEIKSYVKEKNINYNFKKNNIQIKYILERKDEYDNKNRIIKKFIAHILISHSLFEKILNQLRYLIENHIDTNNDKNVVIIGNKNEGLMKYLTTIIREYEYYKLSYEIQKSILNGDKVDLPIWNIQFLLPDTLYTFIDNIFYYNEQGNLAVPLLRTYFEIKFYPYLENIINVIRKKTNNNHDNKIVSFTKEFGIKEFINWCKYLNLLDEFTIDLLLRFYQYASDSSHSGIFFDRIVAHEILYFLNDLTLNSYENVPDDYNSQVQVYISGNKFNLIDDDPISKFNKFQPPSNKRLKAQK